MNRYGAAPAGVADLSTGRPITSDMRHRVGSITKTFTAAAVLQQVERGQIGLDTPISHYLPQLVPGERGDAITVRMLINHTNFLAEHLPPLKAYPALAKTTPDSVNHNRFTRFHPTELIEMGVAALPSAHRPTLREYILIPLPAPLPSHGVRDWHQRGEVHLPECD